MKQKIKILFSLALPALLIVVGLTSCNQSITKKEKKEPTQLKMKHADWTKNANIYEVNIRQYTPEGTINAFRKHLPRLKDMGVDILWLMPVQPIGVKNRKGSLGSYYSVRDYKTVNPEFGTMDDLKALISEAHQKGMHVILDWVANHSSWDNVWAKEHPEYYEKNEDGSFHSPYDWTDVIEFNYDNPAMRDSMIRALEFWVKETDVDGYRCDVAGMVPTDFWNDARTRLEKLKPVFMLAEDEDNVGLVEYAFDMNYTWKMMHLMNDIAKGNKKVSALWDNLAWSKQTFPSYTYRMYFTSNHDENSWNGTTKERLGNGAQAFAVLTYVVPGMPLIYSGQEAGNTKPLRFFEKDTIDWSNVALGGFYKTLNELKKNNNALWNGKAGGEIIEIGRGQNDNVFACERRKADNKILAIINLSAEKQLFSIDSDEFIGDYTDIFRNEKVTIDVGHQFNLKPWEYIVLKNTD